MQRENAMTTLTVYTSEKDIWPYTPEFKVTETIINLGINYYSTQRQIDNGRYVDHDLIYTINMTFENEDDAMRFKAEWAKE